jgi:squalene-hopene/tetraprenyl-beta-curcumene cyclase
VIRRLGGADAANTETRFLLALLGQVNYDCCPAIPPETLTFRGSRLRLPLSIVWSHRPVREVGIERGVRELFVRKPSEWRSAAADARYRPSFSGSARSLLESLLRRCEHRGWTPLRGGALKRAETRLLEQIAPERIEQLDFFELLWHTVAVRTLGFSDESPEVRSCERRLQELVSSDDDGKLVGPRYRTSPLCDTALVLRALLASGVPVDHAAAKCAVTWLSRTQSIESMDTSDLANVDAVIGAVAAREMVFDDALPPVIEVRCSQWHDGGEIQQREEALYHLAGFAKKLGDQRWTEPPKSPALAGVLLTTITADGHERSPAEVDRAVEYLRAAQCADGGWDGEAGSGRVHATALAVRGMIAAGVAGDDRAIMAGVNWLLVHQQPSGGWSDLPAEQDWDQVQQTAGSSGSTSSHTAFVLLALLAAGKANHRAVLRCVQFLVETQEEDGSWQEPHYVLRDAATGRWCGNDLRSVAWPLLALSRWAVAANADRREAAESLPLRLVNGPAGN